MDKKGRRVKCCITGEIGSSSDFVKINGRYYKSQAVYDEHQKDMNFYHKSVDMISDLMGYKPGQVFPTIVAKRLKELQFYGNECLYNTLVANHETLEWYMNNKAFRNDIQRSAYLFAIIKNNINDEYKKINEKKKKEERIDNTYVETGNLEDIGTSVKGRDIGEFLEDK